MSEILEQENAVVLAAAEKMVSLGQDISERTAAGKQSKDKLSHGLQILRLLTAYKDNTFNDDDLEAVLYSLRELSEAELFPTVDPIVGQELVYLVEGGSGSGSMTIQNNGSTLALRDTLNFYNGLFASDDGSIINVGIGGNLTIDATIGLGSANLTIDAGGAGDFAINLGSDAIGDIHYRNASGKVARLASVAAGSFLRSGGVATIPAWSTVKLPDTMSALGLWVANSLNTTVNLTATAEQSIRVNAAGTDWEAYTPIVYTASNGITKSGADFKLGGTLTGSTSISGAFNFNLTTQQNVFTSLAASTYQAGTTFDLFAGTALTITASSGITSLSRHVFTATATLPGINVGSYAGNPSTTANADLWYNSSTSTINTKIAGTNRKILTTNLSEITDTQVVYGTSTSGFLSGNSGLIYSVASSLLTATNLTVVTALKNTALGASGEIPYIGTGGLFKTESALTYDDTNNYISLLNATGVGLSQLYGGALYLNGNSLADRVICDYTGVHKTVGNATIDFGTTVANGSVSITAGTQGTITLTAGNYTGISNGNIVLQPGSGGGAVGYTALGGDVFIGGSTTSNIGIACAISGSFGGGSGVIFIHNANTNPSTNPTAGGILYSDAGALKWRGSSGTVTTVAAA